MEYYRPSVSHRDGKGEFTVRVVPTLALPEEEWLLLESTGWFVDWGGRYFCHTGIEMRYVERARKVKELPNLCANTHVCPGHRICDSLEESKRLSIKIFGAYAWGASVVFEGNTSSDALWRAIFAWERTATTTSIAEDYFYVLR
jgi:hypothetical protein